MCVEQRPEGFGDKELHVGAATVEVGTGALRGFYGGQDYLDSQINWAVAGGMAGSTFKAAADVAAIRDGFALNDTFDGNSPYDRHRRHRVREPGRHRLRLRRLDADARPRTPSTPPSST